MTAVGNKIPPLNKRSHRFGKIPRLGDDSKVQTMIGNDTKLDSGIGTCGKAGPSVPVGVGQPTVKMGGITVGGTEAA